MLDDDELKLVTAAVDGELTATQDAAFRRLLSESMDAARLYQQLTAQSTRLKRLPRVAAPFDVADAVANRLEPIVQVPTRVLHAQSGWNWQFLALAASALFAVSAGGYWFVTRPSGAPTESRLAKADAPKRVPKREGRKPSDAADAGIATAEETPAQPNGGSRPAEVASIGPEPAPAPRLVPQDLIGAALLNAPAPLERVEARLPFLAAVAELDQPDVQGRLSEELGRDSAYRLDLFAQDPLRGIEALQAATREMGVAVVVDAATQERINNKQPAAWAVYSEALSAEDIAKLAAALAAAERAADSPRFGAAHLVPARDAEKRDVRDLLGIELGSTKSAGAGKSIASGTVDQVTAAMNRERAAEKSAILLTYQPVSVRTNPSASKEIREYLSRRDGRKPGAVTLLVVVRPAN